MPEHRPECQIQPGHDQQQHAEPHDHADDLDRNEDADHHQRDSQPAQLRLFICYSSEPWRLCPHCLRSFSQAWSKDCAAPRIGAAQVTIATYLLLGALAAHLMNLPLASRQVTFFTGAASGHLANLPLASWQ